MTGFELLCRDPLADHLVPLVQGKLTDAERAAVEEHLAACPGCRHRLETLEWMAEQASRWGGDLFLPHVGAEDLTAFVDDPSSLPADERSRIERHLELCPGCASDVRLLRDTATGYLSRPAWLDRLLGTARLRHVLVWALVAVLVYPAYVGLLTLTGGRKTARPALWPAGPATVLRSDTQRGPGNETPEVTPAWGRATLELTLPRLERPGVRYDATLERPDGTRLAAVSGLESIDRYGTFRLVLDVRGLKPGPYRLVVRESSVPAGGAPENYLFPFRLTRGKG